MEPLMEPLLPIPLLVVTIPGQPIGKGRPRFSGAKLGRPRTYTPAKTAHWEAVATSLLMTAWGKPPLDDLVELEVLAVLQRPQRLMRARDPEGRIPAGCKPDWDNIGKIVSDALEKAGVVRNDSQVYAGVVRRYYAAKSEGPSVKVRVHLGKE